jgi:hypothetical protein
MKLRLLDTSNLLPIRIIHRPNSIMRFALGKVDVLYRMMPRLLDTSNLLPIRIMHRPNSILRSALGRGEML